jgi:hypothetical protein
MKIKKITKNHFEGKVYNFHCLPNKNYFSEGILVHNCYKCNGGNSPTVHMGFDTFAKVIEKMPKTLTQIAFHLENGKEITLNPKQKIKLSNGKIKLAENLSEDDDIDETQFS